MNHPDEMKGSSSQLLYYLVLHAKWHSLFFGWFSTTDLTVRLSSNRYSMCLILFLSTCSPFPCHTLSTTSLPCMSSHSACVFVSPPVWSLVIMFCVCALLYVLVGDGFLSLWRTLITFSNTSHMWAYHAQIQLICVLDQLFTDCKCFARM